MTETFSWCPMPGAGRNRKQRVVQVDYGDGYRHRTSIGINLNIDDWSVSFTGAQSVIEEIDDFLTNNAVQGFWWTPPGASAAIVVTCLEWTMSWVDKNANGLVGSIQAQFSREYNHQPLT